MMDTLADAGYQAFWEGCERADNPWPEGTDGEHAWLKGWDEANTEFELNTGDSNDT